jgi:hypothetical protein
MNYIFTLLIYTSGYPPVVAMQEFETRAACQVHMLFLKEKLEGLRIKEPYTSLTCTPKGDVK